jgi:hypothetical protein
MQKDTTRPQPKGSSPCCGAELMSVTGLTCCSKCERLLGQWALQPQGGPFLIRNDHGTVMGGYRRFARNSGGSGGR